MSSLILPSQAFRAAWPTAAFTAAGAVAGAIARLAAPLRQASTATQVRALRERAQAHAATDPSYAADLLTAADGAEAIAERA